MRYMNKIILTAVAISTILVYASSCYNNKEDILTLPQISFRNEIVPIVTGGACGCHNNGRPQDAAQFSHFDTIFYDGILSRKALLQTWVNGGIHPGGGVIDFSANEKLIVKRWLDQGGKDDAAGACPVIGAPKYTPDIATIYTTTCKGGTCHGGLGPPLDYLKLTTAANKANLINIANSGGVSGHPGGPISLSSCTVNVLKDWIAQGYPQ
jgi:hypothetical protein